MKIDTDFHKIAESIAKNSVIKAESTIAQSIFEALNDAYQAGWFEGRKNMVKFMSNKMGVRV